MASHRWEWGVRMQTTRGDSIFVDGLPGGGLRRARI
jgi:hypothetical protein